MGDYLGRHTGKEIDDAVDFAGSAAVSGSLLRFAYGGKNYVLSGVQEAVKPNTPTMTASQTFVGPGSITLSCTTSGVTIYYTTNGTTPTTSSTKYTAPFQINQTARIQDTITVKAIAVKNGESSNVASTDYIVKRQVSAVTISADGNDYSTQRTITMTCPTSGAVIHYTTDGTTPTTSSSVYNSASKPTISANATVKTLSVLSDWESKTDSKSFIVGAKKAYYGFSTSSSLANATAIKALATTGGAEESSKLQGAYVINPTGSTAGYVWLCCTGTLDKDSIVPNKGDVIPFGFEAAKAVDGWNCYRSTNAINPEKTNVYIP